MNTTPQPSAFLAGLMLALLVALLLPGCGTSVPKEFTASVEVTGSSAIVTVAVPGKRLGQDYHPHLSLDGGPDVMMYSASYTFGSLKPGSHRVRVVLDDVKHKPIPGLEKVLEFTVN